MLQQDYGLFQGERDPVPLCGSHKYPTAGPPKSGRFRQQRRQGPPVGHYAFAPGVDEPWKTGTVTNYAADGFPATLQQDYAKFEYTPNGQRKAVTDANGNRAEMSFDGFDRLQRWTFPSTGAPGKPPLGQADPADYEEYGYDLIGNRTSLRKRDGSVLTYAYDSLNRVIRKIVPERPGLAAASTRDVYYDYNHALGLMTSARFDSYDGYGVIFFYDPFGQPTTSATIMGGPVRYLFRDRDEAGNLAHLTHGDGVHFSYAYGALGRMTLVHDNGSIASLDDYVIRYWYKPEGPTHAAVRGAAVPGGFTTVFYYDGLQRLCKEARSITCRSL